MTWRCFFCDEVFTTPGAAADHFGASLLDKPGCLIDFQVVTEEGGKPERGRGLLMALRKAETELARYREEDTDLHRALHAKDCERNTAVMQAEEQGYARGLRDGVNLPTDSPERAAIAGVAPAEAPSNVAVSLRNANPARSQEDGYRAASGVKGPDHG